MKNVGDSEIRIGRDRFYHSYEYKTNIKIVIDALEDSDCPKDILKALREWASKPYPEVEDLQRIVSYQYQTKPF